VHTGVQRNGFEMKLSKTRAASSEELSAQALTLNDMIDTFKV